MDRIGREADSTLFSFSVIARHDPEMIFNTALRRLAPRRGGGKRAALFPEVDLRMDLLLSICLGVGLSAACGFRVFIPLLALSGASQYGYIHLAPEWAWIGTTAALWAFGTAAVLEIAAYFVPWIDHLMDGVAAPAAAVAGVLVMASALANVSPLVKWTMAIIAGGGSAALVQGSTMIARGASSAMTGGLGNPAVAAGEAVAAVLLSLLAVLLPVLAGLVVAVLLAFLVRKAVRSRSQGKRERI